MDTAAVYSKLQDIFRDVFDDHHIAVTPDLTADKVEGWDSVTHVRLLLSVERGFGISFSASEVRMLKDVSELASLVQSKVESKGSPKT
jgi:acyl carrier protein